MSVNSYKIHSTITKLGRLKAVSLFLIDNPRYLRIDRSATLGRFLNPNVTIDRTPQVVFFS